MCENYLLLSFSIPYIYFGYIFSHTEVIIWKLLSKIISFFIFLLFYYYFSFSMSNCPSFYFFFLAIAHACHSSNINEAIILTVQTSKLFKNYLVVGELIKSNFQATITGGPKCIVQGGHPKGRALSPRPVSVIRRLVGRSISRTL